MRLPIKIKETNTILDLLPEDVFIIVSEWLDSNDNKITTDKIGNEFEIVLQNGDTEEIILCNGFTYREGNSATLNIAPAGRNRLPYTPFTGSATGKFLSSGASVVLGNSPSWYSQFINSDTDNTFSGTQTFLNSPIIPNGTSNNNPVTVEQLQNIVAGQVGVATTNTNGVVSLSNRDEAIGGASKSQFQGGILNLSMFDNQKDVYKISDTTVIFLGTDNNLYRGIFIGDNVTEVQLSTGTQTQNFTKIIYATNQFNVWLINNENQIYKWNGTTFTLITFTGTTLPAGVCLQAEPIQLSNLTYLIFLNNKKIYSFNTNSNVVSVVNATIDTQYYPFDITLDSVNNLLYIFELDITTLPTDFTTFSISSYISANPTAKLSVYNITTNIYSNGAAINSNTSTDFGRAMINGFNSIKYRNGYLYLTGLLQVSPVSNMQSIVAYPITTNPNGTYSFGVAKYLPLGIAYTPESNTALTTYQNTLNRKIFLGDTLYFIGYTTTANEFQTFYVYTGNTPSSVALTPDVNQIITANTGDLNLNVNKGNVYDPTLLAKRSWNQAILPVTQPAQNGIISSITTSSGGTGLVNGVYNGLIVSQGQITGATANITVANNAITSIVIINGGIGYTDGTVTIAGLTATTQPTFTAVTTKGSRRDLVVVNSSNIPVIRTGSETVLNQTTPPINGDILLGEYTILDTQDSIDYTDIINYDNKGIFEDYFGSGSDGNVTISTNTTLTKDMYYNNLTVNSGATLTTGNFKIYIADTLSGSGTISADLQGALPNSNFLSAGNNGGGNVLIFVNNNNFSGLITSTGGNGVLQSGFIGNYNGNNGGAGGGAGGNSSASGGTTTPLSIAQLNSYLIIQPTFKSFLYSLGNNYPSNNFGWGGSGGISVFSGQSSTGGGGGGTVMVFYRNKLNKYNTNVIGGTGAQQGAQTGQNGVNGNVYEIQLN